MIAALIALALGASTARAQAPAEIRRGDVSVRIQVSGGVEAEDRVRLRANIDGRLETVLVATGAWARLGEPLGELVGTELAALIDSQQSTQKDVVQDRWREIYKPAAIRCPADCFVLTAFLKPKNLVKPQGLLFEAAKTLSLKGRVKPEDARWVRDGQTLTFWPVAEPARRQETRVDDFDARSGAFSTSLSPETFLPPGTAWEGVIVAAERKKVLIAPTSALIRHGGEVYLPVRVSTGLTTREATELTSGAEDGQRVLILDESRLKGAARHAETSEPPVLQVAPNRRSIPQGPGAEGARPRPGEAPAQQVEQDTISDFEPEPPRKPKRRSERFEELRDPDSTYESD